MRRRLLPILVLLLVAAGAAFWWWTRPLPVLNIVTWPGIYGRAQAAAQIQAYNATRRANGRIQLWAENGTLDELRKLVAAHLADVVDLEEPVAVAACKAGLLEPITGLRAGDDGTAAQKDFYSGMTAGCFVASAIYARMIVCPSCPSEAGISDVFALAAKGGKIALQPGAKINLEMALLADGVPPGQVYALLATEAGVARAFARLDAIRPNIVWAGDSQALAALRDGRVQIATALTAEVQAAARKPLAAQFYEADMLAVPKDGTKKELALDYLRFATGTVPLAGMVKFAPYAPPRRSATATVAALPAGAMRDFVAGQGEALEHGFAVDDFWWADHGAALEARFRAWAGGG